MRRLVGFAAALAALLQATVPGPATAQDWPTAGKNIQLIVPAPGGSGTGDAIARVLAEELVKRLKAPIVVELMLRHRSEAYNSIMYAPGGLPRVERELGAMVVSVSNGCVYCTSVHAQRFAQLAKRHNTVEQVFDDPSTAGTTDSERAIARFAQAVTLRPQALGAEDIELLRGVGLDDAEIIDLLHAVAIFAWANRLMQNLGEPAPAAA